MALYGPLRLISLIQCAEHGPPTLRTKTVFKPNTISSTAAPPTDGNSARAAQRPPPRGSGPEPAVTASAGTWRAAPWRSRARRLGASPAQSASQPAVRLTFSTTIQPPYNYHTTTIQSTKDGPTSSSTPAPRCFLFSQARKLQGSGPKVASWPNILNTTPY
jgi:hypothetical protein